MMSRLVSKRLLSSIRSASSTPATISPYLELNLIQSDMEMWLVLEDERKENEKDICLGLS